MRFSFGKNWRSFIDEKYSAELLSRSISALSEFIGPSGLAGCSVLDIGSGSGIHSLAALRLGASSVMSFDLDSDSVAAAEVLRKREGEPSNWILGRGSVLDPAFVEGLGKFDFVYSWGVLHHTGKMWQAIDQAASLVGNNGRLLIAIYQTTSFSTAWLWIKRLYNEAPLPIARSMELIYAAYLLSLKLLRGRSPIKHVREYKSHRGMSFLHDIRDWLGGLPYEHARPEEVVRRLHELGFRLINLDTKSECAQYLFSRY